MFCSECGESLQGKFCSACGAKAAPGGQELVAVDRGVVLQFDWSDLVQYETLIRVPEVRDRIARSAARSKKSFTGEQFLDLCDKAMGGGFGIPMSTIAHFAQGLHAKLGIKNGKVAERGFGAASGDSAGGAAVLAGEPRARGAPGASVDGRMHH